MKFTAWLLELKCESLRVWTLLCLWTVFTSEREILLVHARPAIHFQSTFRGLSFMYLCHLQISIFSHLFHGLCGVSHAVLQWPPFSDTPFHVHWLVHLVSCPSCPWTPGIPISHLHVFPRRVNLSISLLFLQLPPDLIVVKFVPPAVYLGSKPRKMKVPLANLGARELNLFFFSYS